MHNRSLLTAAVIMALSGNVALAAPFGSFDPRSMAMGGTGVASGTGANASFYNPALLAKNKQFHLELPVIGFNIADPDELIKDLDDFQNGNELTALDSAVTNFNLNPNSANAQTVVNSMSDVNNIVKTFSNRALEGSLFGGSVVSFSTENWGMAVQLSGMAAGGAQLDYRDAQTVDTLNSELTQLITLQDAVTNATTNAERIAALQDLQDFAASSQFVQYDPISQTATITNVNPESELQTRAIAVAEVGISLARNFEFSFGEISIGVTPKYMQVSTIDYVANVRSAEFNIDTNKVDSSAFNIDVGVAKRYDNGVTTGLVVKNLIPQSFRTANTTGMGDIDLKPQVRFGVAHSASWNSIASSTLALDLDITENEPVGFDQKTRYLGVGTELDLYRTAQLRVGYKKNLSDGSYADTVTAGFGLSPFGLHLDLALAASPNLEQVAGGLQLGFRY